jgi:hypothetical protein
MPRGTCENCGQHDAFVYASPLALGRSVFVCVRCLNFPHEWDDYENDRSGTLVGELSCCGGT